ncbi:MAG: glycosyltransferase family 39 protein [Candidatus Kapabacteria bacterium]|nr:glycosyltransferase family 39 protein [Candidatus Kapabacteria bacterium]
MGKLIDYYQKLDLKRFILYVCIFSFLIRVAFVLSKGDFEDPEMWEHGDTARYMLAGHGYTMHWPYRAIDEARHELKQDPPPYVGSFMPPLNPYFIYLNFKVLGDNTKAYTSLMLFNVLFGTIAVYLSFLIARLLFNDDTAKFAAILAAIFLPAIVGTVTFSGSQLYQMLALAAIYYLIKYIKFSKSHDILIAGLLCGLQTLVRSEFFALSFALIFGAVLANYLRTANKKSIFNLILAFVAFAAVVGPWTYRNYQLYDKFIPVVTHPWHEIWRGNNIFASGGARNADGRHVWLDGHNDYSVAHRLDSLPLDTRFEIAADSIFRDETIHYWKNNPEKAILNSLLRVVSLWAIDYTSPEIHNPIYFFYVFIITIPALYAFAYSIRKDGLLRNPILVFLLFALFYTVLILTVNFIIRYQIYFLTVLLPVSSYGIYLISQKLIEKYKLKKQITN